MEIKFDILYKGILVIAILHSIAICIASILLYVLCIMKIPIHITIFLSTILILSTIMLAALFNMLFHLITNKNIIDCYNILKKKQKKK